MSNRYYVPCVVTGNALAEVGDRQTPSVKIVLQTQDDQPRTLYADLWLSDAAFEATIVTLEEALGWTGNSLAELNEPILEGIQVTAVCEWEQYNGQNRERVLFLNSPNRGGTKKLEGDRVQFVTQRLDAMLAGKRRQAGAAQQGQGQRRAPAPPATHAQRQAQGNFGGHAPRNQSADPRDYGIPDEGAF